MEHPNPFHNNIARTRRLKKHLHAIIYTESHTQIGQVTTITGAYLDNHPNDPLCKSLLQEFTILNTCPIKDNFDAYEHNHFDHILDEERQKANEHIDKILLDFNNEHLSQEQIQLLLDIYHIVTH